MSALRHFTFYLTFLKFYLLFNVVISDNSQRCGPAINTPGWTTPKGDIVIEQGLPLEIYCTLDLDNPATKGYSAANLIFKNASHRIDSKYVTVVNETTARLYIENVSLSNEMFYCNLELNGSMLPNLQPANSLEVAPTASQSKEMLICLNSVAVGTKPQEVTNFQCVSYNWESLNCTWHQPYNGVKTNYTVAYQTPGRGGRSQWFHCPVYEEERCGWALAYYRRSFEHLNFMVEGVNKFGNVSQQFKMHHYARMIPAAPRSLTAIGKTCSSIYLQWNIGPLSLFEKGLIYKVNYTWDSSPIWNVTLYHYKNVEQNNDIVKLNVSGLKFPNTPYDFEVSMKSAVDMGDSYWSPAASLKVKTKACVPHRSPQTDIGSFNIFNEHPSGRQVLIYWKHIPNEEHNGDNFRYEINVFEEERQINLKPVHVQNSYAKYINLSFNSYRFFIRAANSEGYAPSSTSVYVPRKHDLIPEPVLFTKVDFGQGVYELSWKLADNVGPEVSNFTIFWCENNREWPYQCDTIVNWIHLPANTTKHNITAKGDVGYQFAISVNSVNSSSGMMWAMCTVLYNHPTKMKNVAIHKVDSTYIDLKWRLDCSERVEDIRGYNITYCPISDEDQKKCEQPERTYLVYGDVTTNHGNITDLQPFTNYKMSVAIITDKFLGLPSEPLYSRTKEGAPNMTNVKVEVINITATSAIIKWNQPTLPNGKIHHYEVHYNDATIEVNNTMVELQNLHSYNQYSIKVTACTAVCARTEQVNLHTKIGKPSEVVKPTTEKINSSQTKLKWQPPLMPAGPNPIYEVKIQFDQPDKNSTVEEFTTTETEAILNLPCRPDTPHSAYTFYIRAKNIDDSDPQNQITYVGPWSSAYTINCLQGSSNTILKIVATVSFCIILFAVFTFICRKGFYKWQKIKRVEVELPPKFALPHWFPNEIKDPTYHANIRSWTDNSEDDRLNTKVSDIDQTSIDGVDMDVDTDRETSRSSSGCYTS